MSATAAGPTWPGPVWDSVVADLGDPYSVPRDEAPHPRTRPLPVVPRRQTPPMPPAAPAADPARAEP